MSEAFKGLEDIKDFTQKLSEQSGVTLTVSTVSDEPSNYRHGQFPIDRGHWEQELIRLFAAYAPDRDNAWREYGEEFENDFFWIHRYNQSPECSCVYEKQDKTWLDAHPHATDCFDLFIREKVKAIEERFPEPDFNFFQEVGPAHIASMAQALFGGPGPTDAEIAQERVANRIHEEKRQEWGKAVRLRNAAIVKVVVREARAKGIFESGGVKVDRENAEWIWQYLCTCGRDDAHEDFERQLIHHRPCALWWMDQPNFLFKPTGYGVHWYKYPCRGAHGTALASPEEFTRMIDQCIASVESVKK